MHNNLLSKVVFVGLVGCCLIKCAYATDYKQKIAALDEGSNVSVNIQKIYNNTGSNLYYKDGKEKKELKKDDYVEFVNFIIENTVTEQGYIYDTYGYEGYINIGFTNSPAFSIDFYDSKSANNKLFSITLSTPEAEGNRDLTDGTDVKNLKQDQAVNFKYSLSLTNNTDDKSVSSTKKDDLYVSVYLDTSDTSFLTTFKFVDINKNDSTYSLALRDI